MEAKSQITLTTFTQIMVPILKLNQLIDYRDGPMEIVFESVKEY